mgnify:CR=1 FL=1
MKQLSKYLIALLLVVTALSSSSLAEAAPGERGPRGGGAGGEVTAVSTDSITILNRDEESVVVNVDDNTTVRLVATQSEGSLSDITVGDHVSVRGRRGDEEDTVNARSITVQPAGDKVRGRVASVDGSSISLENRDGSVSVSTDGGTVFFLNGEATSIADVTEGRSVSAYGVTEADDSLSASLVLIRER